MKNKLTIVKAGGLIINDDSLIKVFLENFSKIDGKKIMVHGGGNIASNYMRRLGIDPKMINGRRITDLETLDIAMMTYAGLINKKIVAKLQQLNCNALGLSGADGNIIRSKIREFKEIDFGFVGDIICINDQLILKLLDSKLVPILCSLSHDGAGQILNTNADSIASSLAIEMSKHFDVTLKYCFDKPGLLTDINKPDSIKKHIIKSDYEKLKKDRIIVDGMIPKIENCFFALENGVKEIFIGNQNIINDVKNCTKITLS